MRRVCCQMSLSICDQKSKEPFMCKGNWIKVEHYVIPSKTMPKNERYGYCKICWECDFKDNACYTNPEDIRRNSPYADSKINNAYFNACGNDTL